MFRALSGFRARLGDMTMVVVSEFDEWRVVAYSPEVILQGQRQFKDTKAKEHAEMLVRKFYEEVRNQPLPDASEPEWQPVGPNHWMVWKT